MRSDKCGTSLTPPEGHFIFLSRHGTCRLIFRISWNAGGEMEYKRSCSNVTDIPSSRRRLNVRWVSGVTSRHLENGVATVASCLARYRVFSGSGPLKIETESLSLGPDRRKGWTLVHPACKSSNCGSCIGMYRIKVSILRQSGAAKVPMMIEPRGRTHAVETLREEVLSPFPR